MQKKSKLIANRERFGYFFVSPYIIGLIVFIVIPLAESIRISFSELTVGTDRYNLDFVGLKNYSYIFTVDVNYRKNLLSSFQSMIVSVPVVILFSFFVASVLTTKFKGRGFVRTIAFLPVIITAGAIDKLLAEDYMADTVSASVASGGGEMASSVMSLFGNIGIPDSILSIISTSVNGIYNIVVMSAVPIVIFIAALNSISESIFEAAYVEGATKWEIFWKIKFPISTPQILTCVVYCLIDNLNNSSNVVISKIKTTIYQQWKYGQGAAMSFAYMIMIFVILFAVYKIISKRVTYLE